MYAFGIASLIGSASATKAQCYSATVTGFVDDPVISAYGGDSDFAQVFNPSWIEGSPGTGGKSGLLVRTQNCTGCGLGLDDCCRCAGTEANASILTFAELTNSDSSADDKPSFSHIDSSSVVFGPHDDSDIKGTEDPRVVYDASDELYHVLYTCWGNVDVTPTLCHAVTTNPTTSANWTRLGPIGFGKDSKSGAMLIRDEAPHFLYWGAGHISLTQSDDLSKWTPGEKFITQTLFGHTNVESGPPPMKLSTGDYVFFINSWSNDISDPDWYQPSWVILDGKDPTKIVAQAPKPLISPSQAKWMRGISPYQCNQCNVAFLEAAHPIGPDSFRVYFGGSDAVIGTAVVNFKKLDVPCDAEVIVA